MNNGYTYTNANENSTLTIDKLLEVYKLLENIPKMIDGIVLTDLFCPKNRVLKISCENKEYYFITHEDWKLLKLNFVEKKIENPYGFQNVLGGIPIYDDEDFAKEIIRKVTLNYFKNKDV